MEAMLIHSPLASHSFTSTATGVNIHVYFQDRRGNIEIASYNPKSGWTTGSKGSPGKAHLNNGIAVTGWNNGNEVLELSTAYSSIERVYFIGEGDKIVERCYSKGKEGWYEGVLTGMVTTAHYSSLSAIRLDVRGTGFIRVYYQDKDNAIREVCKDGVGKWFYGHKFPPAIQGTSISCSQIPGKGFYHWLFYQKPDTTFVEHLMREGSQWKEGPFKSDRVYGPGAYIACVSYGEDNHHVFTIDSGNRLCLTEFNTGSQSWYVTGTLTDAIPSSPVAAIPVASFTSRIRIYFQTRGDQIAEWGTNDGTKYRVERYHLPIATPTAISRSAV
ncbi:unnamed protein product [Tuber aestivum]|uniref:Uncharacterized protein n=1 Tax=Tuber aestivum TaxID=59557 RepID=A0A292PHM8_9PEZI|nr:unnamed protein product [Tuber aestivum]